MIVALAGGVGAARFLDGLTRVSPPEELFVIGNTGDDLEVHGLCVSPDIDTVMYTLAGLGDIERGWGLAGDTFHCLKALGRFGAETWFQLGDRDLATHIYRTARLRRGVPLSMVTAEIAEALGVRSKIVPMTDSPVRTWVETEEGTLDFQTYFIRRGARDRVLGVRFEGCEHAQPAAGVLEAIHGAAGVIVCPSNPVISIGPILAVPGIREALRDCAAPVVAITPIVAGRALKGPAAHMLESLHMRASAAQVAKLYRDFIDVFLLDNQDAASVPEIEALGVRAIAANTVMGGARDKEALARAALRAMEESS
jgi:LPPG:FO 2-phospho-L-lactate transferase